LFIGHLEEVRVDWSVNTEGGSFTGLKVPRVTLHFASQHKNASEKRHVYQTLFPQPSNVDTIPGGKEAWKVDNVLKWIKHILDIYYLKGRELTEAEEDALTLALEDYKEENGVYVYVPVDPETDVLPAYRTLFENFVSMMNGTFRDLADGEVAKPCYKTANGDFIPAWLKLLRHKKDRKRGWVNVGRNGELAFDSFIGTGVVELITDGKPPRVLRYDASKESITPKETNKTPTIGGAAAMPGGGVIPDTGIPMGVAALSAYAGAAEEMPF
jgi:hypothetical protein